jgi:phage shock protein PspC (stress-responsive transcriptional regulator)
MKLGLCYGLNVLMFSMQGLINGVNGGLVGMYYGVNEMWVEATCIYCTSPLPFPLAATLVRLLFDLVVVFTLQIFGRVKPLDHLSS